MTLIVSLSPTQSLGSEAIEDKTYFDLIDVDCAHPDSNDCYQNILQNMILKSSFVAKTSNGLGIEPEEVRLISNQYSRYRLSLKSKTNTVIVTIHGLWGDANQFSGTLGQIMDWSPMGKTNVIELTLPGHLKIGPTDEIYKNKIKANPPFSEFSEWIVALEKTLLLAKRLGQHTIIIGQSTGGLLATYAALRYPDLVDEIILYEPALQVNGLMNWGSCVSGHIPEFALKGLSYLVGVPVPEGVSVRMGCEVQKLADQIFVRRFLSESKGPRSDLRYYEDYTPYTQVGTRINIPVLMLNNENDKIVSAEANKYFFKGLKQAKYISTNKFGKLAHGNPATLFVHASEIVEFTKDNLPQSDVGDYWYYNLARDLKAFTLIDPCTLTTREICKKLLPDTFATKERLREKVCLTEPKECDAVEKHLKVIDENRDSKNDSFNESARYIEILSEKISARDNKLTAGH